MKISKSRKRAKLADMSPDERARLAKEVARQKASRDFSAFIHYTFDDYVENWHHRILCEVLERVERFEIRKVIITMPPRRGKSELVSRRFPAYIMGKHPDRDIICATHTMALARKMGRDVERICKSKSYREIFEDFQFDQCTQDVKSTKEGGLYQTASVGNALAGIGCNYFIIDDYVANREAADSDLIRDKVWEWYLDDASTRLNNPSALIIMATRWHEDDLIGRILERDPEGWTIVELPEYLEDEPVGLDPREPGELLWPRFFGLNEDVTDEECVERGLAHRDWRMRDNAYGWSALYQCRPTPKDGTLFRREWMQFYNSDPKDMAAQCDRLILSVDAAFKGGDKSDYVAGVVAGFRDNKVFVLDEFNERMDFPATKSRIRQMHAKWPEATIVIEDKANGPALVAELQKSMPRVIAHDPGRESKESRAQKSADVFESGAVFLPSPDNAPWIGDWIEDHVGFGRRAHDDRVDAFSQLLARWERKSVYKHHLKRILGRLYVE